MHRVLIPPVAVREGPLTISDPRTLHHLLHVLRVEAGEPLECFDGQGRRYLGSVIRCTPRALVVKVDKTCEEPPPALRITLVQALIKPERFEWVIEKATELGVTRILPLLTARTTTRMGSGGATTRLRRWQRIVASAATQCGRAALPRLAAPQRFEATLTELQGSPAFLFSPAAEEVWEERLPQMTQRGELAIFIGPEGDFTPEERALASRAGVQLVRLRSTILRSETAAVAVVAILQHAAGAL